MPTTTIWRSGSRRNGLAAFRGGVGCLFEQIGVAMHPGRIEGEHERPRAGRPGRQTEGARAMRIRRLVQRPGAVAALAGVTGDELRVLRKFMQMEDLER